jgi:hypothetical protein
MATHQSATAKLMIAIAVIAFAVAWWLERAIGLGAIATGATALAVWIRYECRVMDLARLSVAGRGR